MKQHITLEQLREIASEKIVPLIDNGMIKVKDTELIRTNKTAKQFTIGKMMEILDNHTYKSKTTIDFNLSDVTYDCIDGFVIMVIGYKEEAIGHEVLLVLKTHKYNKCDALWETIKEIL